jgi:DNA-binding LacI/PurR family transcriptional regulator
VTSLALRYEGYADALATAGVALDEHLVIEAPFTIDGAREVARSLAAAFGSDDKAAERPTALLALSDRHAIAAMNELRVAGLRVPEDVSVVGADDAEEAEAANLTTVQVPWREMARAATEALLGILSVRGVRRLSVVLETVLVQRGSAVPVAYVVDVADVTAGRA